MATVKMMQGDSFPVPVELKMDGITLTPEHLEDLEITVGENIRKLFSSGEIGYDASLHYWYFIPSQQETFAMDPDGYSVIARVKFRGNDRWDVKGIRCGMINIEESNSKEEL